MTEDDFEAFRTQISMLAITLNEPMSAARVEGYWLALNDLTLDELQRGVETACKESPYFPKPSIIRKYGKPVKDPVRNWEAYKPYRPERPQLEEPPDLLAKMLRATVESLTNRLAEKAQENPVRWLTPAEIQERKRMVREQLKRIQEEG